MEHTLERACSTAVTGAGAFQSARYAFILAQNARQPRNKLCTRLLLKNGSRIAWTGSSDALLTFTTAAAAKAS